MNPLFGNTKEDSIIKVFDAFLSRKIQTRRNVEATTGLSFVTVSKIADALVELKILRQYNLTADSLPRRSRVLVTKQYYWIGCFSFTPDIFSFIAYDLSFKEIYKFQQKPNTKTFPDETVNKFILRSMDFIKSNRIKIPRCIGLGILVPGSYDPHRDKVYNSHIYHFSGFRFKKIFSQYFPEGIIRVSSIYDCCAEEIRHNINDDECVFSFYVERDSIRGAYITKTNAPIVKDTGLIHSLTKKTLNVMAQKPPDIYPFFYDLANIVFSLDHTVPLTKVTIGGNLYPRYDAVASVLHHILSEKYHKIMKIPPNVVHIDIYQSAIINITREMRLKWFKEKIIHQIPSNT